MKPDQVPPPADPVAELEAKLMEKATAFARSDCFSDHYSSDEKGHIYALPALPQEWALVEALERSTLFDPFHIHTLA